MKEAKLVAQVRNGAGRSDSRRLRREGLVPSTIYGCGVKPLSISLDHNLLYHSLKRENFHTSILEIEMDGKHEKVLLRDLQMHPFRSQILHLDFQRIDEAVEIQIRVPLHFINEDISTAVKEQGAHITHIVNEVEIRALAKDIPHFIEVDFKDIKAGQSIHLSNLTLPKGVSLSNLIRGEDSVVAIAAGIEEEQEVVQQEAEVAAADIPTVAGKKETGSDT